MEPQIRLTAEQRETMWREGIGETMLMDREEKDPPLNPPGGEAQWVKIHTLIDKVKNSV